MNNRCIECGGSALTHPPYCVMCRARAERLGEIMRGVTSSTIDLRGVTSSTSTIDLRGVEYRYIYIPGSVRDQQQQRSTSQGWNPAGGRSGEIIGLEFREEERRKKDRRRIQDPDYDRRDPSSHGADERTTMGRRLGWRNDRRQSPFEYAPAPLTRTTGVKGRSAF